MNIAPRVQDYLAAQQSAYELLSHPRSGNSVQTARAAHVPAGCLAKGVVVKDDAGYVLAVLPSSCYVVFRRTAWQGLAVLFLMLAIFAKS